MRSEHLGVVQETPDWLHPYRIRVSTARLCGPNAQTSVDNRQAAPNLRLPSTYLGNVRSDEIARIRAFRAQTLADANAMFAQVATSFATQVRGIDVGRTAARFNAAFDAEDAISLVGA